MNEDQKRQMVNAWREVQRAMDHFMDNGEFPSDVCPADLYTYAVEQVRALEA